MVSQREVVANPPAAQPTTLPADFSEWDSGEDSGAMPASASRYDGFPGAAAAPKPVARQAAAQRAPLPAIERQPAAGMRPGVKSRAESARPAVAPAITQRHRVEVEEDEEPAKSKTMLYVAAAALVVVLGGGGAFLALRPKASAPKPVVATAAIPGTTTIINPGNPNGTTEGPVINPAAGAGAGTIAPDTSARQAAQAAAMQQRLNAASRIPSDLKVAGGKEAPPSENFGNLGDSMGSVGSVFGSQKGPNAVMATPKRVNISGGVAQGLLIQKANPVYPTIARTAHVAGTVVIQATISRQGTILNPRVASGPPMLRQSAVDAVKTWRYRPYMLNGEPVEVETTVNVIFNPN